MQETAAVGSIGHILHTAFKDVYDEFHKKQYAAEARHVREMERLASEEALLHAAPIIEEVKQLEPAKPDPKAKAPPAKKGIKAPETEPEPEPKPEPEPIVDVVVEVCMFSFLIIFHRSTSYTFTIDRNCIIIYTLIYNCTGYRWESIISRLLQSVRAIGA